MGSLLIRLTFPKTRKISKEYSELLLAMLEKDPKKRIKIKYNTIRIKFLPSFVGISAKCLGLMWVYLN